jgi:hypothetical protein
MKIVCDYRSKSVEIKLNDEVISFRFKALPDNPISKLPTATMRDGMTSGIMIPLSI